MTEFSTDEMEFDPEKNAQALDRLLDQMEKASVNQSQRDKGTRFETLCRVFLTDGSSYGNHFTKIQTFKEWAEENRDKTPNAKDIGIDLVGTLQNGGFAAIQCKFYAKDSSVSKSQIDSFIASSERHFEERYIMATNDRWSDNACSAMHSASPEIVLIDRKAMADGGIDWAAYLNAGDVKTVAHRKPRPYQQDAIRNVLNGFATADRGKLIMACGTGKTFTSMKIAEEMEGNGGFVMFLVPSLALLSQTLTDWKQQCKYPINAFAVCSDVTTGKKDLSEVDNLLAVSELSYPATTQADKLAKEAKAALKRKGMTVIFSTYQSIQVVSDAQKKFGLPEIGLTICDEAHRTAGGYLVNDEDADSEESAFLRIHDNGFIQSKKRLYMTATPKIYGTEAKSQRASGDAVLYSMDDETVFGKVFHEISFRRAVELGSLVDYKVIVLTVSEDLVGDRLTYEAVQNGGMNISDAAKVIGSWRALSRFDLKENLPDEMLETEDGKRVLPAMKRAVGFAQVIEPSEKYDRVSSKLFAREFQSVIDRYKVQHKEKLQEQGRYDEATFHQENDLVCETKHIDGSMNANEKEQLLSWLRSDVEDNHCKILFNVRCLSEGVDVPALDAVVFLSPRKSQVEVVQTVGRVMRRSPRTNKQRGYVIIPIVTPPQVAADLILQNNKEFDTVWQILKALRSIDPEFGAAVDGQLKKVNEDKIEVICITDNIPKGRKKGASPRAGKKTGAKKSKSADTQGALDLFRNEILEDELKARIVKKVGNVREWADWAEDVGDICKAQIKHINQILDDPKQEKSRVSFDAFQKELTATINDSMDRETAVEMLAQHIVTKPVMDALFSDYPFMDQNPICQALTEMVNAIDKDEMAASRKRLEDFYKAVQYRARNIKTVAERQIVVRELFDKFFKYAFPKYQDKLGIVYTPEPVVDFINQSVADILKKEFNQSIDDEGVHILDPFTGTGTFLTRLMQSGLISKEKMQHKFEHDLHANEIVPLAYYVASMSLESVYHEQMPESEYKPNNVVVLTDTFANHKQGEMEFKTSFSQNHARLVDLNHKDIRIIVGNPPYSVGQDNQNDDNQNEHYEELDKRLAETYVARTSSTFKGKLYDSYIRAYRWASDRIGDKGIVGFVTNAGWIESNSADGMRKCMAEEFCSIYIYHLKGNARTQGEQRRKEKDNVFGEGSRAPVAVVILVKNPDAKEHGKIYFHAVDDYLSRDEKLKQVIESKSVLNLPMQVIVPDAHGDWLNQRDDSYSHFMRTDGKKSEEPAIFENFSLGVVTSRDSWVFGSSQESVKRNVILSISTYNAQVQEVQSNPGFSIDLNPKLLKWDIPQKNGVTKGRYSDAFSEKRLVNSLYRPFMKQYLYFDRFWNNCVYQMPKLFPENDTQNLVIVVNQSLSDTSIPALMTNFIADLHLNGDSQCFPRYIYSDRETLPNGVLAFDEDSAERTDGITPQALMHFQSAYPEHTQGITVDALFYYIYGILHSEDYRKRYANNLMKELPRIPRVATYEQFKAFSDAGRKLADLHVNYESVPEFSGVTVEQRPGCSFHVSQMRYGKIPGKTGNAAKDKTMIVYNDDITITGIPLEAQEYVVNKKSALDWVVERACVSVDKKSGIVNDFNDYGLEMTPPNPRYPLSLVLRVITVSLETMKIVKSLPKLELHQLDQ